MGGKQTQSADLEISGVLVGGIPAKITEEGLIVGSPTGADGPLAQQLTAVVNDLVRAAKVRVTAVDVEKGVDDSGLAFARSGVCSSSSRPTSRASERCPARSATSTSTASTRV